MADLMLFPETWEEFEASYGFTDSEEVYTNGARLIPSFRVEQWLEHIGSVKHWKWIKITERPMTTDERTKRSEELGYDVEYEDDESIVYTSALPDENKPVLVTREFSCGKRKKRYVEIADRIGNSWFSYSDEYKVGNHGRPIAWMPLPEPYKSGRSEE